MSWIRKARAIGGLLAIVVLLGMVFMGFLNSELHVTDREILLLSTIISALLGVDVLVTQRTRIARAILAGVEEYITSNENEDSSQ